MREFEIASEENCDNWSINLTGKKEDYASCLVEFAKHNLGQLPIGFSESGKALARRLESIFKNQTLLHNNRQLIGIAAGVIGAIFIISFIRIVGFHSPEPSETDNTSQSEFISELAQGLNNPSNTVRRRVVDILGGIGEPAIPALIAALNDSNETVQCRAIYIGPHKKDH